MKATRFLCLAAMLVCAYFGLRIFLHETNSSGFQAQPVQQQLHQIEDREELLERVELLLQTLEKADERIHDWRGLTVRAWWSAAFMFSMVLLASFVWHRTPTLDEQLEHLEKQLDA